MDDEGAGAAGSAGVEAAGVGRRPWLVEGDRFGDALEPQEALGDVGQGAIYDRGVHVYAMGGSGPCNDALGRGTVSFVGRRFPGLRPRRILELGCGVGHNLIPYADAYPEAEIHGVDIGAPMLRRCTRA